MKWRALAVKLDLAHPAVQDCDTLVRMQHYILTTRHDMRCKCTRGIVLNMTTEHFPECDAIPGLELKAKQLAEIDA